MKKPGLLTRVIQKAFSEMVFPNGQNWHFTMPNTNTDYKSKVGQGDGSSVLMAVMFWIMRRMADSQYQLLKNNEVIEQHELLNLLKKPNQHYSGRLLRMGTALSYSMDGNAYWLKIRNGRLKPVQLWYVPHWLVEPHWPEGRTDTYIDYYKYYTGCDWKEILPEDIVHFRFGIDPYNTRKGMSPIKSLFREIFTDDEASNFTASLMTNMGIPGLIISPGSDNATVKEGDKKAVEKRFDDLKGDKRGKTVVMSSKTEVKQFGFTPVQMDLGRLRQIPEERVTAVLGVPAAVVGFGTGLEQTAVGATLAQMVGMAYDDCIIPMQNSLTDEIDGQLLPDFEGKPEIWHLEFDLSKVRVLQEDENAKAERVRGLAKDLILTQGEARHELNYESGPEHDVWLVPMSITPTPINDFGLPIETTPSIIPIAPEQVPTNEDEAAKAFYLPYSVDVKSIGWKLKLIRELNKSHGRLSDSYSKTLQKSFTKYGLQAQWAWESIVEQRGIKSAKVQTKDNLDELYANLILGEIGDDIIDYRPHFLRVARETFDTIEVITGMGVALTDANEARIVERGGTRKGLLDIKGDTKKAVMQALGEARELGEGPYKAAMRIREYVGKGRYSSAKIRADVIARTETKYAQNVSSLDAYKSAGCSRVEIVDGQLPTSDEECIARNGQIMGIDEAYNLDEHPNGTLSWTPIIEHITMGGES
jgi:HK97 family phage portal protein